MYHINQITKNLVIWACQGNQGVKQRNNWVLPIIGQKPMKKVYAYSWFKSEVLHPLPWSLISWCPDLKDNYQFNCLFSYIFKENINPLPLLLHVFWASFGPPGLDFNLFYCSCFIEGQQRFFCVIRFLRSHKNWAS